MPLYKKSSALVQKAIDFPVKKNVSEQEKPRKARKTSMAAVIPIQPEMSEYEQQRWENIQRNEEMIRALQISEAKLELYHTSAAVMPCMKTTMARRVTTTKRKKESNEERLARMSTPRLPSRVSGRLRGLTASESACSYSSDYVKENHYTSQGTVISLEPRLRTANEHFSEEIQRKALRTDGHFHGWLKEEVCIKYGIGTCAADAWERNGGGKFSFKNPTGEKTNGKRTGRPLGWSDAKTIALKMFKKNPNCYFYRHNEPGVEQWTGDWLEEERELFMEVARQFGCGDKWGLFASYIPHRVGYQCANFYRQYILPQGIVFDPNYLYSSEGRAVFIGVVTTKNEENEF